MMNALLKSVALGMMLWFNKGLIIDDTNILPPENINRIGAGSIIGLILAAIGILYSSSGNTPFNPGEITASPKSLITSLILGIFLGIAKVVIFAKNIATFATKEAQGSKGMALWGVKDGIPELGEFFLDKLSELDAIEKKAIFAIKFLIGYHLFFALLNSFYWNSVKV
ncbi:MAG: hypothetical protein INQ03_17410 [Candidatus Heimdallarchaeota archaeon]|nr:hypothetical protein [Candidatus Heimdallarchaeota archaeon]